MNYAIIDSETLGGARNTYCPPYHIAATTLDEESKINILILRNLDMTRAFYGQMKREYYRELLKNPSVKICYTEEEAMTLMWEWLLENDIDYICAYNSGFDFTKTCLKDLVEHYDFIDIYQAFYETIGQYKKYNNFCSENGYITNSNNLRMTAEIAYRFISGDNDFIEEHTALSDSEIEAEILKAILKTHRKITRNIHKDWRKNVKVRG